MKTINIVGARKLAQLILGSSLLALVACGGGAKGGGTLKGSGLGGNKPPPPPSNVAPDPTGKDAPKREVSNDERKDYGAALAAFAQNDKGGWNESACRGSADKFASVVRAHPKMVEAQFMVGLSFHRCNMLNDAEKAYQGAVGMKNNHGQSLSNLGELYYRAGKITEARTYWDSAIKANGKLIAARNNVASMELEQMRKLQLGSAEWKKLEEDARFNLSNVLGVDSENVKAYTLYGLVYMEGFQKNKNRLDLAKLLMDEANKRDPKYPPLQNAYGLYYMHRNALSEALVHFQQAVAADPKFVEARMNVGLTTLGFRKYETAKEQFTEVIRLAPKTYDAHIGLGVAMRGLKDYDAAEGRYNDAAKLDPKRGEAYYNLAVLYKDFKATKQEPAASIPTYNKAKDYFRQFVDKGGNPDDIKEAKEQIALIDKTVTQTQKFIEAMKNAPQQPPTPPTAPPAKK
ncbi:MAG: tetratricopeptide repeat protein [Gemmatimonadaceae bacterium]|nr:tetratricopeptide repeat protein [Gemmatimonadaceae bacterium]